MHARMECGGIRARTVTFVLGAVGSALGVTRFVGLHHIAKLISTIPAVATANPCVLMAQAAATSAAPVRHPDGTRIGGPRAPHACRCEHIRIDYEAARTLVEKVRPAMVDDTRRETVVVTAIEGNSWVPNVIARPRTVDQIESVEHHASVHV